MSTQRVVTGFDDRGRPISEWRQVTDDPGPAYGFMEPAHSAPVERRKATPEELAAARAREDEPDHLVAKPPTVIAPFDPARQRASILRGGAVTGELNRRQDAPRTAASYRPKPQPSSEEPVVSEVPPNIPQIIPDANGEYLALADAAREVAYADAAAQAAQEALQMARERLATALAGVGLAQPAAPGLTAPPAVVDAPAIPKPARRAAPGGQVKRAVDTDKRARLVLAALERHGGNTKAAGDELGMRGNIVALIAKRARARQAVSA